MTMLCAVKTIFCHWLDTLWQILCVQVWYAELGSIPSGMQFGCESQAVLPELRRMHDRGHGPLLREWRHFQICAAFHFAGMARSYGKGDIFRYTRRFNSRAWPAPTGMATLSNKRGVLFRGRFAIAAKCRSHSNNSDAWGMTSVGTTFSRDVGYWSSRQNAAPTNNRVSAFINKHLYGSALAVAGVRLRVCRAIVAAAGRCRWPCRRDCRRRRLLRLFSAIAAGVFSRY